jgi:hypothetical protein
VERKFTTLLLTGLMNEIGDTVGNWN